MATINLIIAFTLFTIGAFLLIVIGYALRELQYIRDSERAREKKYGMYDYTKEEPGCISLFPRKKRSTRFGR